MKKHLIRLKQIEGDLNRSLLVSGHVTASLILKAYHGGPGTLTLILPFIIVLIISLAIKGELNKNLNRDTPFLIVMLTQVIFFFWAAFTYQIYILLLIYGIGSVYSIYSPFFREVFSQDD